MRGSQFELRRMLSKTRYTHCTKKREKNKQCVTTIEIRLPVSEYKNSRVAENNRKKLFTLWEQQRRGQERVRQALARQQQVQLRPEQHQRQQQKQQEEGWAAFPLQEQEQQLRALRVREQPASLASTPCAQL